MHVRRTRSELQFGLQREARVVLALGRRGNVDGADLLGFLQRFVRPGAAIDVVGSLAGAEQVHRHHRELQAGATLQEEHLVVRRHVRERADVGLGFRENRLERLRAVADFEHGHADARQRDDLGLDLFENGQRQDCGTRREIEHAIHGSHENLRKVRSKPEGPAHGQAHG
ncbi:MAG: hypothetical protein QM736_25800 [Vicinamibacterales bacterium]